MVWGFATKQVQMARENLSKLMDGAGRISSVLVLRKGTVVPQADGRSLLQLPHKRFMSLTPQVVTFLLPGAKNPVSTSNACWYCPMFVLLIIFIMFSRYMFLSYFSRNSIFGKFLQLSRSSCWTTFFLISTNKDPRYSMEIWKEVRILQPLFKRIVFEFLKQHLLCNA